MWQAQFQALLDEQNQWFNTGVIVGSGTTDTTHKVVTDTQLDGTTISYQYVLQPDPNCLLNRLGFTVAEVQAAIASA